eukprot:11220570-Lingulodinium_polyedra.AAC.1
MGTGAPARVLGAARGIPRPPALALAEQDGDAASSADADSGTEGSSSARSVWTSSAGSAADSRTLSRRREQFGP